MLFQQASHDIVFIPCQLTVRRLDAGKISHRIVGIGGLFPFCIGFLHYATERIVLHADRAAEWVGYRFRLFIICIGYGRTVTARGRDTREVPGGIVGETGDLSQGISDRLDIIDPVDCHIGIGRCRAGHGIVGAYDISPIVTDLGDNHAVGVNGGVRLAAT